MIFEALDLFNWQVPKHVGCLKMTKWLPASGQKKQNLTSYWGFDLLIILISNAIQMKGGDLEKYDFQLKTVRKKGWT